MCLFPIFLSSKPILDSNKQKEANYTGEEREILTVKRKLANMYTRKSGNASPSARYVSHNRVTR